MSKYWLIILALFAISPAIGQEEEEGGDYELTVPGVGNRSIVTPTKMNAASTKVTIIWLVTVNV